MIYKPDKNYLSRRTLSDICRAEALFVQFKFAVFAL